MDTVTMIGRLLVSLAAVLGLMWFIGRRMKRGGRAKATQLIDVLGRQQLSRNASVAVVRVGEQALVIGVTDAQVSVLGETDLGAAQAMITAGTELRKPATRTAAHRAAPPATSPGTAAPTPTAPTAAPAPTVPTDHLRTTKPALAGSALSPQTWRQTLDSLRELTTRQA
jgi:flagellar protein FliO/FliZ